MVTCHKCGAVAYTIVELGRHFCVEISPAPEESNGCPSDERLLTVEENRSGMKTIEEMLKEIDNCDKTILSLQLKKRELRNKIREARIDARWEKRELKIMEKQAKEKNIELDVEVIKKKLLS